MEQNLQKLMAMYIITLIQSEKKFEGILRQGNVKIKNNIRVIIINNI